MSSLQIDAAKNAAFLGNAGVVHPKRIYDAAQQPATRVPSALPTPWPSTVDPKKMDRMIKMANELSKSLNKGNGITHETRRHGKKDALSSLFKKAPRRARRKAKSQPRAPENARLVVKELSRADTLVKHMKGQKNPAQGRAGNNKQLKILHSLRSFVLNSLHTPKSGK